MKIKKKIQKVSLEKSFSNKKFSLKGYLLILIQLRKKKKKIYLEQNIITKRIEFLLQNVTGKFFYTPQQKLVAKRGRYSKIRRFCYQTR